jgi:hypothetical protein
VFVAQGVVCGLKNWFLKSRFNRGVRRMLWMFKKVRCMVIYEVRGEVRIINIIRYNICFNLLYMSCKKNLHDVVLFT